MATEPEISPEALDSFIQDFLIDPDGPQKLRKLYIRVPTGEDPSPVETVVFPRPASKQYCGGFSEESLGKSEHQYQPGHEGVSRKMLRSLEEDAARGSARRAEESRGSK